jgi:DoxX-like family
VNTITVLAFGSGVAFVIYGALCLSSASMQSEFIRFGLERFRVLTGILEVLGGVGLLVGLKWPPALGLSSGGLATLMLCGVIVRVVVNDRAVDMLPAFILMLVNGYISWLSWTRA